MWKELKVVFVDYGKAFDKVKHEVIIYEIKEINIDGKHIRSLIPVLESNSY